MTAENQDKNRCHGVEKEEDEERRHKSDVPSSAPDQPRDEVMFEGRGQVQGVVLLQKESYYMFNLLEKEKRRDENKRRPGQGVRKPLVQQLKREEGGRNIGPVIGKTEEGTIYREREKSTLLDMQETFNCQTGPLAWESEIKNRFEVLEMEKKVVDL
ncbi:hypothetical protein BTVI_123026 [Pitangus sulphuratus]|nr:hypothetical protein BTVI_123026 [Pitangus sulphuratus]